MEGRAEDDPEKADQFSWVHRPAWKVLDGPARAL